LIDDELAEKKNARTLLRNSVTMVRATCVPVVQHSFGGTR